MKVLNLKQRSEEWFSFREGKITGSKANDYAKPRLVLKAELIAFAESKGYIIANKSITVKNIRDMMSQEDLNELDYSIQINDAIYKLIAEKIAKPINENDYADQLNGRRFSMAVRGEILEEEALEKVNEILGKKFTPGRVWQSDWNHEAIVSPDGELIVGLEDGHELIEEAVEIKCLDSWKVVKAYYEKTYPVDYHMQVVQYFAVNEHLKTLHFAIYSDAFAAAPAMECQIFTIKRDDVQQEVEMAIQLENNVLALVDREVQKIMF